MRLVAHGQALFAALVAVAALASASSAAPLTAPATTSFSPSAAVLGGSVTINGSAFTGATDVSSAESRLRSPSSRM